MDSNDEFVFMPDFRFQDYFNKSDIVFWGVVLLIIIFWWYWNRCAAGVERERIIKNNKDAADRKAARRAKRGE